MEPSEIRQLVDRLRAEGRALTGDGFGRTGYLKSAYKKVSKQLEEFAQQLENAPPEAPSIANELLNPNCFGTGVGENINVPGCECRRVAQLIRFIPVV